MTENGTNKVFVVTGATSGIGLAITEGLLKRNQSVIGIGRSPERCSQLQGHLQAKHPQQKMIYLVADLSLQPEVRAVGRDVELTLDGWGIRELSGLVNNAGTFSFWQKLTTEGFEIQWAVNHLAPFLLTNLLLPLLKKSNDARVVTISSGSHYGAKLNWTDLQGMERYNPLKAYKHTKLANVLFTSELSRRLGPDSPVHCVAADPGLVNTSIGEKAGSKLAKKIWGRRRNKGISAEQSAAGIIRLLLETDLSHTSEIYWKHGKTKKPNPFALEKDNGWRLWKISSQMTGISQMGPNN